MYIFVLNGLLVKTCQVLEIEIKKPPVVRAAFVLTYSVIYFALTVAILTENRSLIIRTARTTIIRERL